MKTIITLLFTCFTITFNAQDLTITAGNSLRLSTSSLLYINGMELQSSSNYNITGPNTISKSNTAINAQSVNLVYNLSSALSAYQGDLIFKYEDVNLNGINESNLVLMTKDMSNSWNSTASTINTTTNTLSFSFSSPTDIYGITASNSTTLHINSFDNTELRLFPNPVNSKLNISCKYDVEIKIYNVLGSMVLKTTNKLIDVSHLDNNIYLVEIKNIAKNIKTYRKIIKK